MAAIWETTDRLGRNVVLSDEAWEHVLFEHDRMAGRVEDVREAVARADEVVRDRAFAHRNVHYKVIVPDRLWLRVIVHYRPHPPAGWTGEVITAHFISRRYRREAPLWP